MDQIVIDVRTCKHCGKEHLDLDAHRRDELGPDNSTHAAKCPETGKEIPVWHSGF